MLVFADLQEGPSRGFSAGNRHSGGISAGKRCADSPPEFSGRGPCRVDVEAGPGPAGPRPGRFLRRPPPGRERDPRAAAGGGRPRRSSPTVSEVRSSCWRHESYRTCLAEFPHSRAAAGGGAAAERAPVQRPPHRRGRLGHGLRQRAHPPRRGARRRARESERERESEIDESERARSTGAGERDRRGPPAPSRFGLRRS